MWNKGLCFISILIMCAIGIALMFVKQKPEKRELKKHSTQHLKRAGKRKRGNLYEF